ncbi:MAG: PAS domain S-box protein [Acidobacteriota bacterium]
MDRNAGREWPYLDDGGGRLLRKILENALDLFTVLDASGRILYQNPASERALGLSPDVLLGTRLFDRVHPDDRVSLEAAFSRATEAPEEMLFADFRFQKADGSYAILEALGQNLLRDPDVAGFVLHSRDITEPQRLLDNLRLLHRALASSRNGVVITDPSQPDNPIVFLNSAFEAITGYAIPEALGRNCRFLHGTDRDQPALEEIRRAVAERREARAILRNYRKDGTPFWNDLQIFPVRDDFGRVTHFVGIQNDITERLQAEEALKRSEAQFKAMFEGAPIGIALVDVEGHPKVANPALAEMLGYTVEELRGLTFADFTHPQDLYLDLKLFRDLMAGKRDHYRMEKRYVRKDGRVFWGALSVALARGPGGEPLFAVGMVSDIQRRREAEAALRSRDAVLETASLAAERLLRIDDWTQALPEVLERLGRSLQVSAAALYEKPVKECHAERRACWTDPDAYGVEPPPTPPPPQCRPEWLVPAWIEALSKGQAVAASPAEPSLGLGFDSPWLGRSVALVPIFSGTEWWGILLLEEHRVVRAWSAAELEVLRTLAGTLGAAVRRQKDLLALKESEARVRSLLDNMLGGLFSVSPEGIVEMANPAAERIFGYTREELVGRHVRELIVVPEGQDEEAYFREAYRKALGRITEWEARRKNGEVFPVELSFFEFRTSEGRRFAGNVQDISQRKEVERLKKEFVSTVSHELRTPLTSIRGSLGLLQGGVAGELSPQAKNLVEIALKNAERLVRLINDILDIEKIEAGRMVFDFKEMPLKPLLLQALEANQGFAAQFGVRLEAAALPPEDWKVRVDTDRLLQVLTNLLSNAVKFSPAGGVVELLAEQRGGEVRVTVRDHGPGIPEAFRSRIFSKFAQADSSDTRKKGGTGLGLSIAKAIVEKMGGRIGFFSRDGEGTDFFFDLPLAGDRVPRPPEGAPRPKAVLHVEDDPDLLDIVPSIVAPLAEVVPAPTLAEARRLLGSRPFDLLLLDLTLPDGDGLTLLREAAPGTLPPVLVFSAEDPPHPVPPGILRFLVKGRTTNEALKEAVREALSR